MAGSSGARESVKHLLRALSSGSCRCPAHSNTYNPVGPSGKLSGGYAGGRHGNCKTHATSTVQTDYAFEMACSNIRYGLGVTREVGMDCRNIGMKKVCVMTDPTLAGLAPVTTALESLTKAGVPFELYDRVRVEPTDSSFEAAINFAKKGGFDGFLAVGGGSVIDTCKAANLFSSKPDAELLDFVIAPTGRGLPIEHQLHPLVAVPTTAGTGSETTGVAVFDYEPMKAKVGIANRALRPLLGIVDPLHTLTMPERVAANSGFDVLCHALESYTALPYNERTPRPADPKERPAYQGSNPISDVWSLHALRVVSKYMRRAVKNSDDLEARSNMHLASTFAGIGFGNAGVHLCHGMSYPVSGNVKSYFAADYNKTHPLVPHGLSVVMTAPAVFSYTYSACPGRHLEAAEILGADIRGIKQDDAGRILADTLREYMLDLGVDNGLKALGYTTSDIPDLVKGTLPQHRVTKLSPRPQTEEDLAGLFEASMVVY